MADFRELSTDPAIKLASIAAVATDNAMVVSLSPNSALPAGTNSVGTVQPPALTKGTQGATGVSTQDLKDAGRNISSWFMLLPVLTTATETLQTLTGYKGGAAQTATLTPAVVTTGKIYRITQIQMTYVETATIGTARFSLRAQTGGVVTVSSPVVGNWSVGSVSATAGVTSQMEVAFPDGIELAAGTGIGISVVGLSPLQVATAGGYAQVAVYGYEY